MISLNGENGKIEIEILGYQDAKARCSDDRNWLDCKLSVQYGCSLFVVNCAIQTYDIRMLCEELQRGQKTFKWIFPDDDASIEFVLNDGIVTHVVFLWHQKISEEVISVSALINVGKSSKDISADIWSLMMEFPVLD